MKPWGNKTQYYYIYALQVRQLVLKGHLPWHLRSARVVIRRSSVTCIEHFTRLLVASVRDDDITMQDSPVFEHWMVGWYIQLNYGGLAKLAIYDQYPGSWQCVVFLLRTSCAELLHMQRLECYGLQSGH